MNSYFLIRMHGCMNSLVSRYMNSYFLMYEFISGGAMCEVPPSLWSSKFANIARVIWFQKGDIASPFSMELPHKKFWKTFYGTLPAEFSKLGDCGTGTYGVSYSTLYLVLWYSEVSGQIL
jgi:hypothetical protein